LCEVFTDKLVAKIPSTASGVVKQINFSNDQICAVGHPILTIELDDGKKTETTTQTTD
jgi:pyruvate/2-oxoglutarate dehydrogenase complex dihydrolipoamide acyltransferase (E2) component